MFSHFIGGIDPDVQAHFLRMTSSDASLRGDLSELILGLKQDGIWDKIKFLSVVHDNSADSLLNLKYTSSFGDATAVNSPTFTANRGFLCANTGTKYIDTKLGSRDVFDSGTSVHSFGYCRTSNPLSSGATDSIVTAVRTTLGTNTLTTQAILGYIANEGVLLNTLQNQRGTIMDSRDSTTNTLNVLLNDSSTAGTTITTPSIDADDTVKVGSNYNGTTAYDVEMSAWGGGTYLTLAEMALYEDRIRAYMQARAADVY